MASQGLSRTSENGKFFFSGWNPKLVLVKYSARLSAQSDSSQGASFNEQPGHAGSQPGNNQGTPKVKPLVSIELHSPSEPAKGLDLDGTLTLIRLELFRNQTGDQTRSLFQDLT